MNCWGKWSAHTCFGRHWINTSGGKRIQIFFFFFVTHFLFCVKRLYFFSFLLYCLPVMLSQSQLHCTSTTEKNQWRSKMEESPSNEKQRNDLCIRNCWHYRHIEHAHLPTNFQQQKTSQWTLYSNGNGLIYVLRAL